MDTSKTFMTASINVYLIIIYKYLKKKTLVRMRTSISIYMDYSLRTTELYK
jgi:hypothetical protein